MVKETPEKSGKYEILADPADYKLIVTKEGFEQTVKLLTAKSGANFFKIPLTQKTFVEHQHDEIYLKKEKIDNNKMKKSSKEFKNKDIEVYIYDAMNSAPIPNAKVRVIENNNKNASNFQTNNDGITGISVKSQVEGKLVIENNNYFSIEENFIPNKMNSNTIQLPLIKKPENENELQIFVSINFKNKLLSLNVITPGNL